MKDTFQPEGENINDFDLIVHDEMLYAVFVRKTPYPKENIDAKKPNRFGLARSPDGKAWEDLGTVLEPIAETWEQSLWAGGVAHRDGQFVLYYTGVTETREASSQIGRAFSRDLRLWSKDDANPILTLSAGNPYYSDEPVHCFRDPYPMMINGKRYLLIGAKDKAQPEGKRGCIGFIEERIDGRFTFHPPLFSPGSYNVLECPALYTIGTYWYLLFGDDTKKVFRYARADQPLGPFIEPRENQLLPENFYNVRFVHFRGEWRSYCWMRDFPNGIVRERLVGPYGVDIGRDGSLTLRDEM